MPIFAYEFGNTGSDIPVHIECVGVDSEEKNRQLRLFLMNEAIANELDVKEGAEDGELPYEAFGKTPDEVAQRVGGLRSTLEVILMASPKNLPVAVVARLLDKALERDDSRVVITDKETGVMLYRYSSNLSGKELCGDSIDPNSLSSLEGVTSDEAFIIQAIKHGCNYYGYTPEPRPSKGRDFTSHYTLGHMQEGVFAPVVTILDESHPVRAAQAEACKVVEH